MTMRGQLLASVLHVAARIAARLQRNAALAPASVGRRLARSPFNATAPRIVRVGNHAVLRRPRRGSTAAGSAAPIQSTSTRAWRRASYAGPSRTAPTRVPIACPTRTVGTGSRFATNSDEARSCGHSSARVQGVPFNGQHGRRIASTSRLSIRRAPSE